MVFLAGDPGGSILTWVKGGSAVASLPVPGNVSESVRSRGSLSNTLCKSLDAVLLCVSRSDKNPQSARTRDTEQEAVPPFYRLPGAPDKRRDEKLPSALHRTSTPGIIHEVLPLISSHPPKFVPYERKSGAKGTPVGAEREHPCVPFLR